MTPTIVDGVAFLGTCSPSCKLSSIPRAHQLTAIDVELNKTLWQADIGEEPG